MPKVKNSDYWKERFKQLEEAQNRKGADTYAEIEQQYRRALRELEGKISTWYQRFADNNGVSMAEARKMLSKNELKEFKWDVNDYIQYGKKNALNQQWMKELENASAKFHISRLEALKLQTQQSLEVMFGNQLDSIDAAMKRIYLDGYYHTAYELQKGFQIGWDIAGLDQRKIEKVISKPWAVDGKNFSERIWGNRQKLISEIHKELTQDIILGRDPQKAIDAIAKKMNTSKVNAGRLIMTEEAYFSSAAQKECFSDLDVEEYEIVATLDSHTSDICQNMDGKVFPMKDYEPGVTAPPFHVWCRSCTVPHFSENFGQIGKRAARGEDGKTYYVPADMTYPEWKKAFVDGGNKPEPQKDVDIDRGILLNENERKAVIKYVSPDSIILNDKLRRGEALTEEEKTWVKNLNSALEKLPCYEGNLNRSLTFNSEEDAKNFYDRFVIGEEYIPKQFLSTTKAGVYNDEGQVQIYIERARKGKDLGNLAIENEVLYSDTSRFIIINKVIEAGKYWILLGEI